MLGQLQGTLQRSVATERALRKKMADITSEQQALRARVTDLTAVLNTTTAERDRLRSDLVSRDERLATVHAELQSANTALQQAQAETGTSSQQLSEARSQAETVNNELTELKTQLESQKTTLLNAEQTRTEERDRLHSDLASRDKQLASVQAELQTAREAIQQAQAETFNNELTELKVQLESQKTMLLDAEQTLAAEIDERDGLQTNLATCNRELTQAQVALTDVRSVEDALRQAPPTAAGVTAPQTANTDTDEDSVPDSIDLCPDTQHGIAVNSTGCAADVAINLDGVNFLYNSHELTDEARGILDRVADSLIQLPELRLEVAGHTDATGDPTYNQELSMQRAEAVRDYLVAQGANPRYIGAAGYGGQRPIADNTTLEGLQQNRRVELHILQ
jgi:outer membrane protein OmpA-like peptidoglycan-associated protein